MKLENCIGVLFFGVLTIAIPAVFFLIPGMKWGGVIILAIYACLVIQFVVENGYITIRNKIAPETMFDDRVGTVGEILGWVVAVLVSCAGVYLTFRYLF